MRASRFTQNSSFPSRANHKARFSVKRRGVTRKAGSVLHSKSKKRTRVRKDQPSVHRRALDCQLEWSSLREERIFLNHFLRREITTPILVSNFLSYFSKSLEDFQTSSESFYKVEISCPSAETLAEWIGCDVVF